MAEGGGGGIPGWAIFLIIIVGLWFIIGKLGQTANSTIAQIGATKANTAQGYANAATTAFSGLGSALGSFFGSSSPTPAPAQSFTSVPTAGGLATQPDAAAVSSYNQISTSDLDTLAAQDDAAGVEGPF